MTDPISSNYHGWHWDEENSTLEVWVGTGGASDPLEILRLSTSSPLVTVYRNDTSTTAALRIEQDSTGDPVLEFLLTGGAEWSMGIDNGSSDTFVISAGGDLGTGDEDAVRITDATPPVITYNAAHPTGTFDYVCEACHWHGGREEDSCPSCGGSVEWHDDVAALVPALAAKDAFNLHSPALRHLADIGVIDLTINEQSGNPQLFVQMANAQWYTWSGMAQLHQRIQELEKIAA